MALTGIPCVGLAGCAADKGGGDGNASSGANSTGGATSAGGAKSLGGAAAGGTTAHSGAPSNGGANSTSSSSSSSATGGASSETTAAKGGAAAGGATILQGGSTSTHEGGASGGSSGASGSNGSNGGTKSSVGGSATGAGGSSAGSVGGNSSSSTGGMIAGGSSSGGTSSGGTSSGGSSGFTLTSPSHADGAMFASKYTCADKGFNGSMLPELRWTAGPAGTKSYAITFIDVTLTGKTPPDSKGYHWVIYNIPATVNSLAEGLTDAQAKALPAKENSAFLGPCPNFGSAPPTGPNTDTYEFTLYALASETVTFSSSNVVADAQNKLEANHLARTKLTGKSNAAHN